MTPDQVEHGSETPWLAQAACAFRCRFGEIIAYAVTDEFVSDTPLLKALVGEAACAGHAFRVVYADGAYSSDGNCAYLCKDNRHSFVTSFRSNTSPTNNGAAARGEAACPW